MNEGVKSYIYLRGVILWFHVQHGTIFRQPDKKGTVINILIFECLTLDSSGAAVTVRAQLSVSCRWKHSTTFFPVFFSFPEFSLIVVLFKRFFLTRLFLLKNTNAYFFLLLFSKELFYWCNVQALLELTFMKDRTCFRHID